MSVLGEIGFPPQQRCSRQPGQPNPSVAVVEIDMNAQPTASYFDPTCASRGTSANSERRRQQPPRVSLRRPTTALSSASSNHQPQAQGPAGHSFAAPPRPLSLGHFQQSLRDLELEMPAAVLEEKVKGLMFLLTPDVLQQIEPLRNAPGTSMRQFVDSVLALKPGLKLRLSFGTTLAEFKQKVEAIIARHREASSNELAPSAGAPTATVESEIVWLMDLLGPESREVVEELFFSRSSLDDFRRQLATAERRRKRPISFDHYYLGTVFDMLMEKDCNFNAVSPFDYVQRHVIMKMRVALAEWMLEVCIKFKFCTETFFLAIALLDRFLMVQYVTQQELQLAGVSATLLASKYEEIFPPDIREFVGIAANSFSKEDVIRMERLIFTRLQFGVTVATSNAIGQVLLAEQDPTPEEEQLHIVHYILSTVAVNTYFGQHRQALVAAAAVHMSRVWCDIPTGTPSAEVAALIPVLGGMLALNQQAARNPGQASAQSSLAKVFSTSQFLRVSTLPIPPSFLHLA
jgi:hypothetical protein